MQIKFFVKTDPDNIHSDLWTRVHTNNTRLAPAVGEVWEVRPTEAYLVNHVHVKTYTSPHTIICFVEPWEYDPSRLLKSKVE